ncbi:MAG TPA: TetR/AcrR family transcriptional regulator [Streptosporangiaceae bacterium]|nr:TetR/AcrR family transcriptional regulator [Streptosporangiaceae bacterium]
MAQSAEPARQRVRDPDRKQRILAAAAALGARRGFHAISMADIGAEAGIVGSGIYRHFGSKTSILVALLDQVMDRIANGGTAVIAAGGSDAFVLSELVRDHIAVAIEDREILAVYRHESHTLPEEDRRRLRRRQRHFIEDWVHLLAPLRTDLTDGELRLAVHAAIGAIQSTLFFRSGLPKAQLATRLEEMAHGCLGIAVVPARNGEADGSELSLTTA